MAGRYLATELQDENGDVIYPHTEADIVFASDGTTVEENLGGEVTDADIQEIFGDSQVEAGKKLSVKEKIKKALKRYQTLLAMKILDTVEEVEANTDAGYLMGAKAGAELINDLTFPDGAKFYPDVKDGVRGYNTDAARGADTFNPFRQKPVLLASGISSLNPYSYICTSISGYEKLTSSNFLIVLRSINHTAQSIDTDHNAITKTYNANTGKLTISQCYLAKGLKYTSGSNLQVYTAYDLYLVR